VHTHVGQLAPRNPWGAATLEWAMATPPPSYNVGSLPEIESRDPLAADPALPAHLAAGRGYLGKPRPGLRETLAVDVVRGRPDHVILLPGPTWLPLWAGVATGCFFVPFLLSWYLLSGAGALLTLAVLLYWA